MSEFTDTVREAVALFAARDRDHARFGAARHGYTFAPPLAPARLEAIEREAFGDARGENVRFPDDYREHVTLLGDGGAGPYHGLLPLDHPVQRRLARGAFDRADPYAGGAIGLGHLGCGYLALLVVDPASDARGQVWIDARGAGAGVGAAYPSFHHYVSDWITRLAHADWLEAFVGPGACALPNALSAYFRAVEERQGLAEGTLEGDALREALDAIPDGGIATTHDGTTPFFGAGDRVDVCVACARLMENLGLRSTLIEPGLPPIPVRQIP